MCRAPRGMIESSLTGTMGGRSPPAQHTHTCKPTHDTIIYWSPFSRKRI